LARVQIFGNHFSRCFSGGLRDAANYAAAGGNRQRSRAGGFIAAELDQSRRREIARAAAFQAGSAARFLHSHQ
jgi:hypothetical protein